MRYSCFPAKYTIVFQQTISVVCHYSLYSLKKLGELPSNCFTKPLSAYIKQNYFHLTNDSTSKEAWLRTATCHEKGGPGWN